MPHILLVEDDADVRLMIEHVLVAAGHDVDALATMEGALDRLESRPYDLVVADAKLPDGTGMTVLDRARERGTTGFIVTGYAFTLPAAAVEKYEMLLKPARPAEIVAAVDQALRTKTRC